MVVAACISSLSSLLGIGRVVLWSRRRWNVEDRIPIACIAERPWPDDEIDSRDGEGDRGTDANVPKIRRLPAFEREKVDSPEDCADNEALKAARPKRPDRVRMSRAVLARRVTVRLVAAATAISATAIASATINPATRGVAAFAPRSGRAMIG